MSKPRVIIADEDENYIIPLQFKFVIEFFNKIDLEIITDRTYFEDFFSKPQNAEILIISDALYDSTLQKHNIQNIFVMMEQFDEGGTGELNVNQLFKYTSIKEIFNEIIGKSAGALNSAAVEKKETKIIVVTSAAGGVGKTTVAMGVAACLAKNYKRVLYINASRLQNFQYFFDNKTPISSPEVYSKLLNPTEHVFDDIKHVIRKELFSYLPAFKAALMSVGLEFSIFEKIIVSAKKSGDYDFIIVDAESTFDENQTNLISLSDRVIVITEQSLSSIFATNMFVSNLNGAYGDKFVFVCNKFNKDAYNALIIPEIECKFNISEYIDYYNDERKKIDDLIGKQEIQRISFLII